VETATIKERRGFVLSMAVESERRRMLTIATAGSLLLASFSTVGCTSGCGLGLVQRIPFTSGSGSGPTTIAPKVPCCGASVFQDVILTGKDIEQVDLANTDLGAERVDAFLTTADCNRLFEASYNGSASQPLCKVYIGPVSPGAVSNKVTVPKGVYRVFAQAWASNEQSNGYGIDVGIWSTACRAPLTAPTQ
jgi:hypothetical protein